MLQKRQKLRWLRPLDRSCIVKLLEVVVHECRATRLKVTAVHRPLLSGPRPMLTHSAGQRQKPFSFSNSSPAFLHKMLVSFGSKDSFHLRGLIFLFDTLLLIFLYSTKEPSPVPHSQLHNCSFVVNESLNDCILFDCRSD